jgi:hypothetical protein
MTLARAVLVSGYPARFKLLLDRRVRDPGKQRTLALGRTFRSSDERVQRTISFQEGWKAFDSVAEDRIRFSL